MVDVRILKENRCRGAMAAEAALIFPVILFVTFGALRLGWYYIKAQQITNAARYGARVAIRADASTDDVLNAIGHLLGPDCAKILPTNDVTDYVTFMVRNEPWDSIGDVTPEGEDPVAMGDAITVTVRITPADIVSGPPPFIINLNPDEIRASVTMCKEGS